jgi:hypothetical protein
MASKHLEEVTQQRRIHNELKQLNGIKQKQLTKVEELYQEIKSAETII